MKRIQLISLLTCLNLTGFAFVANAADSNESNPIYPQAPGDLVRHLTQDQEDKKAQIMKRLGELQQACLMFEAAEKPIFGKKSATKGKLQEHSSKIEALIKQIRERLEWWKSSYEALLASRVELHKQLYVEQKKKR